MKGILHKTEQGWIVIYDEVIGENIVKKNQNSLPLENNGHIDGLKLYDSNEGLEVDFEIVNGYDNNGPDHFPKFARILIPEEAELKDWDATLNDGLENEPYVSDDFQIGPDGAYEHTEDWPEDTTPREKAKSELINLLLYQIMDLTTMSKIELGDDVITEIRRLKDVIKIGEQEIEKNKTMTPREKASELIVDYQMVVTSLDYNEAKHCALVMVDEIKRILYDQDSMIRYDYWFEVKQEIEKL